MDLGGRGGAIKAIDIEGNEGDRGVGGGRGVRGGGWGYRGWWVEARPRNYAGGSPLLVSGVSLLPFAFFFFDPFDFAEFPDFSDEGVFDLSVKTSSIWRKGASAKREEEVVLCLRRVVRGVGSRRGRLAGVVGGVDGEESTMSSSTSAPLCEGGVSTTRGEVSSRLGVISFA